MVFNCCKCNTSFSSKCNLNNHIQKQVCIKKLEKHKCNTCDKNFQVNRN